MPRLPQLLIPYSQFKPDFIRHLVVISTVLTLAVTCFKPAWGVYFGAGAGLGILFNLSMFLTVEAPKRSWVLALTAGRVVTVGFLIVLLGRFGLSNILIVISGFLSYKIVLIIQFIRYSVGLSPSRGK